MIKLHFVMIHLLKYGLVGLSGVAVDFGLTWLCKEKILLNKYLANAVGFSFAVLSNFLLNRYWTFNNDIVHPVFPQLTKFILVALIGLLINYILLRILTNFTKKNFYFLKLIVVGIVFLWNYCINTYFTFKH